MTLIEADWFCVLKVAVGLGVLKLSTLDWLWQPVNKAPVNKPASNSAFLLNCIIKDPFSFNDFEKV